MGVPLFLLAATITGSINTSMFLVYAVGKISASNMSGLRKTTVLCFSTEFGDAKLCCDFLFPISMNGFEVFPEGAVFVVVVWRSAEETSFIVQESKLLSKPSSPRCAEGHRLTQILSEFLEKKKTI